MWAAIRADARIYRQLRFGRGGFRAWYRVWFNSPGLFVLAIYRMNHYVLQRRRTQGWTWQTLALKAFVNPGIQLSVLIGKAEFDGDGVIGPGVYLSDRGHLVMGAKSIGTGSVIHHRVTIGMDLVDLGKVAVGENVWIGPDSVIFGEISVGEGCTILPHTVLNRSVPPRCIVGGNPARILRREFDNAGLRRSLVSDVTLDRLDAT
jgi:serine O-acetyltransferase